MPDTAKETFNYKIISNTENEITVSGVIDVNEITAGNTFAVIYGNLVKATISTPNSGDKQVKFFRNQGSNSFADGDGIFNGPCEVCHTQTNHFRNDGTAPDQTHQNIDGGQQGANCVGVCHSHANGFAHGQGGQASLGCVQCHGHEEGTVYDPDMMFPYELPQEPGAATSQGRGTAKSHSTHTEVDADDAKGPGIYCDDCHDINDMPYFKSGFDDDLDGRISLTETDVCDACHSPGGTYDGLNDSAAGAKNNWRTGVYEADSTTLQSGKEKWCATCHDEVPSQISGVAAPNVVGDEDGAYKYGTGWGYYKTGHGLRGDENYPSKGGVESLAGRPIECGSCHDLSAAHIDGDARTFDCGVDQTECDPAEYRASYRLKTVNGQEPMEIPKLGFTTNISDQFRLCAQCHASGPFIDGNDFNTNFATWDGTYINRHVSHLNMHFRIWPPDYDFSEYADIDGDGNLELVAASRPTCITCHNVHGSTSLAMVRDGKLIGREPGLEIWYANEDLALWAWGGALPEPENIPLSASTGTIWRTYSAGNVCTGCHIPGLVARYRCAADVNGDPDCTSYIPPYQVGALQPPTLDWTGENGYGADGVEPENASPGTLFSFRVKYTDLNNDAPAPIQLWIDKDDDGAYENDAVDPDLDETIDMAEIDPSDVSTWDGKIYTANIRLYKAGDNIFTYRFHAVGGGDAVELPSGADLIVSVSNNQPVLSWTGESYFETDGVHLNTGGLGGNYEFRITVSDADNECPVSGSDEIQVWIDENDNGYEAGEKHNLIEADAGDADCTDGKIYKLTKTLSIPGPHNYRFYATDGMATAAGDAGPVGDNTVTVNPTANNPPQLDWLDGNCAASGVTPALGAAGENFEFAMKYTDPDGCPSAGVFQVWIDMDGGGYSGSEQHDMAEVDPSDTDCTDGKLYSYTTAIAPAGSYNYRFYANDGSDDAVGEAATTSTVEAIDAVAVHAGESIQAAITWDVTILVYEGTYTESLSFTTGQGNNSNVTLQSVCGPELTAIQASAGTDSAVYIQGVSNPIIDGFTITGGINEGILLNGKLLVKNCIIENNGRGISSLTTSSALTVEDTIIRNNTVAGVGAGIYYNSGGPHSISGSVLTNNEATGNSGGAIYLQNSSLGLTIANTIISNNTASSGGGIQARYSKLDMDKATVSGNTSTGSGGGLYLSDGALVAMTNCNIVDNTAGSYGGGLFLGNYNNAPIDLNMTNCTVSNNKLTDTTNGLGGGLYNRLSNASINNSIFWGNKAAGIYSAHEAYASMDVGNTFSFASSDVLNIQNNFSTTGGSIDFDAACIGADPLFVDSDNGNYHLKPISPAIDQANAENAPVDDIDGDDRIVNAPPDMGADEYVAPGAEMMATNAAGNDNGTQLLAASSDSFSVSPSGNILRAPSDYPTVQDAINAAFDGDEIIVGDGNYSETIDFKGKAVLVVSENGPENCSINNAIFNSGEGRNSELSGFSFSPAGDGDKGLQIRLCFHGNYSDSRRSNRDCRRLSADNKMHC